MAPITFSEITHVLRGRLCLVSSTLELRRFDTPTATGAEFKLQEREAARQDARSRAEDFSERCFIKCLISVRTQVICGHEDPEEGAG
jgi:hypothetical protein